MKQLRNTLIRAGLDAISVSGLHHVLRPVLGGVGIIFMLHHVRPASAAPFQPNRHLEVTPDFLRETLAHLRALDIDVVTLDEAHRRLTQHDFARRFACFTFDDGYRDNRNHALPVMREFHAPLMVYVATDFAQGDGRLWWVALERAIAAATSIDARIGGTHLRLDAATPQDKQTAFARIHDALRKLPTDHDVQHEVHTLARAHGIDDEAISRELCLSWDELRDFARDPLVSIGAHTVSHCNLAHESAEMMTQQMQISRARIEARLECKVRHFAYPYGDRDAAAAREFAAARALGFDTAVTTRPGVLFTEHADHLTALPRISLNGNYQSTRFLSVLTSGTATAVWNGFRRVDAA
jgi:peptidoglycan/xylan/chitin deacetylase (PgdA/CDA1 family)